MRSLTRPRWIVALSAVALFAAIALAQPQQTPPQQPPAQQQPGQPQQRPLFPNPVDLVTVPTKKKTDEKPTSSASLKVSGPFTHKNLTIFMLHGKDRFAGKNYATAHEALDQKKLVIFETKSVSQLQMENVSADESIIILAGDIYKGGQQDRVARFDMILPPKSGKKPLHVFCVEHTASRWMRPYTGKDRQFAASYDVLNSKALRLSNSLHMSQGGVWKNVAGVQAKLSSKLGASAQDKKSDSSLALTLKLKKVREAADEYLAKLQAAGKGKSDVIGYAFAINGKIYGADVYGNTHLFRKVWPRLIRANAIEAVAEFDKDKKHPMVSAADVRKFMADAEKGQTYTQEVEGVRRLSSEAKSSALFESRHPKGRMSLRRLYLAY